MNPKPSNEQKALAKAIDALSERLGNAYIPANDRDHRFERTGWLMLRTAVLMIASGDRAHALAADWCARGFPSATGGEPGGNGAAWKIDDEYGYTDSVTVTSTEAAALQSDEWEKRRDQLALLRRWLDDNARDIESHIADTIRVLPNEGRRDSLSPCANPNCDATVTGLGDDRLKKGRCPRCYLFQWKHGRDWNQRLEPVDA